MVEWGDLTNSWEKKRSKRKRRKRKTYPSECKVPRTARRDKKAFLSEQCKEIEENNRKTIEGKTRDLFKKTRDTKGTFHAKMGKIKDKKVKDLTEAEEIKKRWQEDTEKLYRKGLQWCESQICWESEIKWCLGSITTNKGSRGDGIPAELFQILKNDSVEVLHSICQHIWKTQ